jgi:hypothetical protein
VSSVPLPPVESQPDGEPRLDPMRTWLVNGERKVDRRRRFGIHGRARGMLVVDQPQNGDVGRWHGLTSSLTRHTVRGGLSELKPEEQRVISLAYLQGRTNQEIADELGVSVTTARRRLWTALKRLEDYIAGVGVWLTALLLAAGAFLLTRVTRLVHSVNALAASPDKAERLAAAVSAGVVTAAALGVIAFAPDAVAPSKVHMNAGLPANSTDAKFVMPPDASQAAPLTTLTIGPTELLAPVKTKPQKESNGQPQTGSSPAGNHGANGCHGNPTGAPAPTPVRSHGNGPPVNPPGKGGCPALGGG